VALVARAGTAAPASAFAGAIDAEIASQNEQFLAAAEAMPEGRFSSSPESLHLPGSELEGVRSFAQQVKHVAADNFAIWAPLTGKPEPAGLNAPNGPPAMTSRDEILKFLKDSFAYSREAAATLTPENALGLVEFRGRQVTRIALVALAMTHMSNHYGQMAVYLRLFGVVPPASRPMRVASLGGPAAP
jgi:uncharacterized damage-inducible protein DinB